MKLARPLPDGAAGDRRRPSPPSSRARRPATRPRRRSRRPRSRRPGSSTCAWPTTPSRRSSPAILAAPGCAGAASPPRRPRVGQRRVRVGQPDRAAPRRQRPRRLRRRPAVPRPRGGRPAGDARVLLQRLGRPGPEPRRVGRGAPARRARPRGRLPRRLRRRPRRGAARTTSGPRRRAGGADTDGIVGHWAAGRVREGIEASLEPTSASTSTSGRARRALHDEGWVERAVERLRERGHVYEQDGAIWFRSTDVRRRQGPGHLSARTASRPTSRPTSAT